MEKPLGSTLRLTGPARTSRLSVRRLAALAVTSAAVLAPACIELPIDDQRIATPEDRMVVNPAPAERDFAGQNARHRVLLAVIDTGVDYNHPLLAENIHFTLGPSGRPERLGYDYIGEDGWPAPYVARTSRYDRRVDEADRALSQLEARNASRLVEKFPDMARFFHPSRNVEQETTAPVDHGTHVAGLMVHDRIDIGLLAYRVYPYNRAPERKGAPPRDELAELDRMLRAAIDQAVADGARVVNLSLGIHAEAENPERYQRVKRYQRHLARVVKSHPEVLFVAAAGNSGALLDEEQRVSYPCGMDAPNVFCVGALTANGDAWEKSDIPASGLDAVFVLGVDVLSTVPVGLCRVDSIAVLAKPDASDDDLAELACAARNRCDSSLFLEKKTGTSMAAPLIARLAGEILIEHPGLTPSGVIRTIHRRSTPADIGGHAIRKLRVPIPSWYLLEHAPPGGAPLSTAALRAPGYWEAYLPDSGAPRGAPSQ